jgi:predicted site-specific integrase-resolvase
LTRFGFEYLKNYLAEFNVSLHHLHELDEKTPESEMVEDLVAIIHSFSGKLYRMRRLGKQEAPNSFPGSRPEDLNSSSSLTF